MFRRSRQELYEIIKEAQTELENIKFLPEDTYPIGTYLEFTQYEDKWLALKTSNISNPEEGSLWYSYHDNTLICWEQLFPGNTEGLMICVLTPSVVWKDGDRKAS